MSGFLCYFRKSCINCYFSCYPSPYSRHSVAVLKKDYSTVIAHGRVHTAQQRPQLLRITQESPVTFISATSEEEGMHFWIWNSHLRGSHFPMLSILMVSWSTFLIQAISQTFLYVFLLVPQMQFSSSVIHRLWQSSEASLMHWEVKEINDNWSGMTY